MVSDNLNVPLPDHYISTLAHGYSADVGGQMGKMVEPTSMSRWDNPGPGLLRGNLHFPVKLHLLLLRIVASQ